MTAKTSRTALAAHLDRAAEACSDAITNHIGTARPDLVFQRKTLFGIAALQGCAALPAPEDADIRLAMNAASEAAGACRTQEPTEAMITVAARLDDAARACAQVIGETPDDRRQWTRFLFADADVEVMRKGREWHVRAGGRTARNKLLDVALDEVLATTNHRLAEMDVQILHWFANDRLDH
jgi:hypothetical protein